MTYQQFRKWYREQNPKAHHSEIKEEYIKRYSFNGKTQPTYYYATPNGSILPNRFAKGVIREGERHRFNPDGSLTIITDD